MIWVEWLRPTSLLSLFIGQAASLILQRHRGIGAINAREARTRNLRDPRSRVAYDRVVDATETRTAGADVDGIDRQTDSTKHLKATLLRLPLIVHDMAPVVCLRTRRCQPKTRSSTPSHAACSRSFRSRPLAFHSLTSTARTQAFHAVSSSPPSASVQRSRASRRDCSTARAAVTLGAALRTCSQTKRRRSHSDSGYTSTRSKRRAVASRNTAA